MGGLAVLSHDVPARSERSFCVSAVCVAATVRGVRCHHDVASVAGSGPESCTGVWMGRGTAGLRRVVPGWRGLARWPRPDCALTARRPQAARPVRVQANRTASCEVYSVFGDGIAVAVVVASLAPLSWRCGGMILDR